MQKSFIKISSRDITVADLKAMLNSQIQLAQLTELVDQARHTHMELDGKSLSERFFTEVKKIIS
jgi:hypothetical protein